MQGKENAHVMLGMVMAVMMVVPSVDYERR